MSLYMCPRTPGAFGVWREGYLGASGYEAACLLARSTEVWEVELHLGPFFAIVDQKGLKGHLKVREVEEEEENEKTCRRNGRFLSRMGLL